MTTDDNAIASLQGHIRDLEQEIIDTKRMVNRLVVRKGQPALYPDGALDGDHGGVFSIRSDQFYGQALATAIREYLKLRRVANLGPATVNEIYDALCRGGFKFETQNEDYRKRNLRLSLVKNSSLFHRLPNGTHYGLPDWYAEIAKKLEATPVKTKRAKAKGKSKGKRVSKGARLLQLEDHNAYRPPVADGGEASGPERSPPTMINAVREGVLAMKGEFTKQQVVDWIEQRYPRLKAEQKKTSVYSMMSNLKHELKFETAVAGKGTAPHTFRRAENVNTVRI